MEDEINLQDYIEILLRRWYVIAVVVVIAVAYTCLPMLSQKKMYEAGAAMLIKDSSGGTISNQVAGLIFGMKISSGTGGNATFVSILGSRSVAEKVLDNLNLTNRMVGWSLPGVKRQDLVTAVQGMPRYLNEKGFFMIKIATEDPVLSADLANAFARAGAEYWNRMNYTEARKKREYIESQLPRVESDLRRAENNLKKFSLISPDSSFLQGVEYKRLERESQIQGETYTMLKKEYEAVKLEESKQLDPFTIVDPAEVPLKPVKSKALLNLAIGLVAGIFLGTILAFSLEYIEKLGKSINK